MTKKKSKKTKKKKKTGKKTGNKKTSPKSKKKTKTKKKSRKKTEKKKQKKPTARLLQNKAIVKKDYQSLHQNGYGKEIEGRLELALMETIYLLEKDKIKVKKGKKKLTPEDVLTQGIEQDERLHEKYTVYKDLRDRGLLVKSGLKFGCDFRCYERGVKTVKRGPKAPKEHTKWIVHAVQEGYTCSFQELSRAVRLAHNIRAKMLWALVDDEGGVTYYEVVRKKI